MTRLAQKLKTLGLSADDTPGGAPTRAQAASSSKARLTFRVFFPMPPFHGAHFNALKAGHGCFNFTGLLLGVGGRQLQKIKQESHARVEVVNAHGNLNGTHPDPLDEDLHALITADSMAKLHKAVDLVVSVLSPTNASFESFKLEPGGSTRLVVAQPVRKPAAADKLKLAKPLYSHPSSSSSSGGGGAKQGWSSLDSSSSTCSGRGMPPSPALTPVTPAATNGRHRSMFASSASSTNSCSSSRAPTPSPSAPNSSRAGTEAGLHEQQQQQGSGAATGGSDAGHGYMDALRLPPAALAAEEPAVLQEEWPALQSCHSKRSDAHNNSTSSHNSNSSKAAIAVKLDSSSTTGGSRSKDTEPLDVQQQSDRTNSRPGHASSAFPQVEPAAGSAGQVNGSSSSYTSAAEGAAKAAGADSQTLQSAGVSLDSDTTRTLSPLTPLAEHHQQHSRTGLFELSSHTHEQQQQHLQGVHMGRSLSRIGSSLQTPGAADAPGAADGQLTPVTLPPPAAAYKSSVPPGFEQQQPLQGSHRQHCDLDLMLLRQRAGYVAQACLLGDSTQALCSSASCTCAGPTAAAPVALQQPCGVSGDGAGGLMGPSTEFSSFAGYAGGVGALGGDLLAAPYSLAGHGGVGPGLAPAFASHDAYQQLLQQQDYELRLQFRQQEQLMHAAAPANLHGANASLSSSNMDSLMPAQPIGAQPGMLGPGWDIADYSRANTAAVAAAASAAFGTPSVGGGGGVAGSLSAAGSFMASNSIW